jgi:hypothetical protein
VLSTKCQNRSYTGWFSPSCLVRNAICRALVGCPLVSASIGFEGIRLKMMKPTTSSVRKLTTAAASLRPR